MQHPAGRLLLLFCLASTSGTLAQQSDPSRSSVEELRSELEQTDDRNALARIELKLAYRAELDIAERQAFALSALEHLGAQGDAGLRSLGLSSVCWTHVRLGRPELAAEACDEAARLARDAGDSSRLHTAVSSRAALAFELGELDAAFVDFTEAARLAEELDNLHHIASAYNNLGSMARLRGAFVQAVTYYERALSAAERIDSAYLEASIVNNLALIALELEMPAEAHARYEQMREIARLGEIENLLFAARAGIARARLALGENEAAVDELRVLVAEGSALAEPMQLSAALDALARAELAVDDPAAALTAARAAFDGYLRAGAERRAYRAQTTLALALAATNDRDAALAAVDTVIEESADPHERQRALDARSEILATSGEHRRAYAALREAVLARGRLDGVRAREQLAIMRSNRERAKTERELVDLRSRQSAIEARARRDRWIGVGAVAGTAALLLVGLLYRRATVAERENARARRRQERDAALKAELERQVERRSDELHREISERRELERQLEQKRKLEALGQLTGGIAHDFNNLMTVVQGAMEVLRDQRGTPIADRQLDVIEQAAGAARSGAEITQSLLAFARVQTLRPSALVLTEFMERVEGLIHRAVGEGVVLRWSCEPSDLTVFADSSHLTTALINLVANARDSMGGRGRVTLRASAAETSDRVEIRIVDTGSGMSPEELERACEPFYSTKGPEAGSGLGLSMVFGFAGQSGGDLRLDSTPGSGTAAILSLPRTAPDLRSQQSERSDPTATFDGKRALLVEDRPDVREVGREMLRCLGFSVEALDSADAARAWFERGERTDVLVSDIVMPGEMNGVELANWLDEHRPDTPVLLTSGFHHAFPAAEMRARFLQKPYSLEELEAALREALGND